MRYSSAWFLTACFFGSTCLSFGGEDSDKDRDKARSEIKAHFRIIESCIDSLKVRVPDRKNAVDRVEPLQGPVMKYSDPVRNYTAAGVWRIGGTGRPRGLVTMEYWPKENVGAGMLFYEFLTFRKDGLEFRSTNGFQKRSSEGAFDFKTLTVDKAKSQSPVARLLVMKSLLRRFKVTENHEGNLTELRFLPRPIHRYKDPDAGIVDGALFAFVYGTNPELIVALEFDGTDWRYATGRLTWVETKVEFDEKVVATYERIRSQPVRGSYLGAGHREETARR